MLHGRTPGGKLIEIAFPASVTALGYFGREIAKGIEKHAANVDEARGRMTEPCNSQGASDV